MLRHVVLVAPQIAPNTGNIIRLCANTGAHLHLVEPLGFEIDDRRLRRAGLDYHDLTIVERHADLASVRSSLDVSPDRWFAITAKGATRHDQITYQPDDVLVFGSEQAGLAPEVLADFPVTQQVHIPMRPSNRSLNLANAVTVVLYEAWRQTDFEPRER